jgi:RNA polymerase sigma-70 factor (ECF subfamily)
MLPTHACSAPASLPASYQPFTAADPEGRFEVLFRSYRGAIQSFLARILGSQEDAEDAVMQTFLKAWRSRDTFRGDTSEKRWLYGIAQRVAIDVIRARVRRPAEALDALGELEPPVADRQAPQDPADIVLDAADREEIRALVHRLPEEQRCLVELHYFEGYRYEEIAARLRIPLSQVRGRLYRIRKTIHNLLPREN